MSLSTERSRGNVVFLLPILWGYMFMCTDREYRVPLYSLSILSTDSLAHPTSPIPTYVSILAPSTTLIILVRY